jgi:predicted RecB family nuclease
MPASVKKLKTCPKGHQFYKSSDCPTCPICDKENKPVSGFLSLISAPARRSLEREGIKSLTQLAKYSEKELLELHGMGPKAIAKLKNILADNSISFSSSP